MVSPLPPALAEATLPRAPLEVLRRLKEAGFRAFLVGGCVRDLLRGATPKDYDLASSALPQEVMRVFPKTLPTGIEHGTVTVRLEGENIEVTTFRSEGEYLDGRRPSSVSFRTEIIDDLARRDFTFNAMAFDPVEKVLVDPFGGQGDLLARRVRCVRDAHERFNEDGLRTIRAVRFAAVLDCTLDPATEAAIPLALDCFRKVATERIQIEFEKLLMAAKARRGVELLDRTGLLAEVLPELSPLRADLPEIIERTPSRLEVRLACLFVASGVSPLDALKRLKFPNKVIDRVQRLVLHADLASLATAEDAALRRFLANLGLDALDDTLAVARALATDTTQSVVLDVSDRLSRVATIRPPLTTRDLALNGGEIMRALSIGPSPLVGEATRFLLDQVLEDPSQNTAEALTKTLENWRRSRSS